MPNVRSVLCGLVCVFIAQAVHAQGSGVEEQMTELRQQIKKEKSVLQDLKQRHERLIAGVEASDRDCVERSADQPIVPSRAPLEIELEKIQRQSLLRQKSLVDEKLRLLFTKRIEAERKKRASEEQQLEALLFACRQKQRVDRRPVQVVFPKDDPTADRLNKELDMLLKKQEKLTLKGIALEKEMKEATGR